HLNLQVRRATLWPLARNKKFKKFCITRGEGRMQAAKVKRRRHSRAEIATKLAEANDLAMQGKLQSEIVRTLGVSAMALRRWRKAVLGAQGGVAAPHDTGQPDGTRGADDRIAELQLENSRLRRLVTDLLLGKIKLEEAAQSQTIRRVKGRDEHC